MSGCYYCGTTEAELRPYGPGGSPLCFACMKADPEREAEAGRNLEAQLDAAQAASDIGSAILAHGQAPNPLTAESAEQLEGSPAVEITPVDNGPGAS